MATLAADKTRTYEVGAAGPEFNHVPVVASDIIFAGAAVGDNGSGLARPLQGTDVFIGFAAEQADNSAGAASAIDVKVRTRGAVELSVIGAASAADMSELVYADDDNTFTLSLAIDNPSIGKVKRWITGTTCLVEFEAASARSV